MNKDLVQAKPKMLKYVSIKDDAKSNGEYQKEENLDELHEFLYDNKVIKEKIDVKMLLQMNVLLK